MKSIEAYHRLRDTKAITLDTADAAAWLGLSSSHASRVLERLSQAGRLLRLKRGLWGFEDRLDPLTLPERLVAPQPCYISLQTALYHHGMISQIPELVYAISTARTRRWTTPVATVSIHHVHPSLLCGYETSGTPPVNMASPEKALFDCLYLSPTRSRLFARLPELELPATFDIRKTSHFTECIPSQRRKTLVLNRLASLVT